MEREGRRRKTKHRGTQELDEKGEGETGDRYNIKEEGDGKNQATYTRSHVMQPRAS